MPINEPLDQLRLSIETSPGKTRIRYAGGGTLSPMPCRALTLVLTALAAGGCGVDFAYLVPAVAGQIDLLRRSVPIEEAISSGRLSDEQVDKLTLIQDVRAFARDTIGLSVADNYTTFYDSGGQPVAYNLSASRKDAFAPRLWTFPFVGTVPYLGYFDLDAARARMDELSRQNLDVFMYEIDAYSGIGIFANPILSPMLKREDIHLVETVLHELLHSTIWRAGDTSFNESLATFVGRRGALTYFSARRPDDAALLTTASMQFEDTDRYSDFAIEWYNELEAYYATDLTSEQKIARREAVFQAGRSRFAAEVQPLMNLPANYDWVAEAPTNNAWMLGVRRYNLDLDMFEQVFTATGEDWRESLDAFEAASGADEPFEFLRRWVADRDPAPAS